MLSFFIILSILLLHIGGISMRRGSYAKAVSTASSVKN